MENNSSTQVGDSGYEEDQESEEGGSLIDLITTDVFPWNWISQYCSREVNRRTRIFGNLCQTSIIFVHMFVILAFYPRQLKMLAQESDESYLKTELNCSRYYLFDWKNLTYYEVRTETMNVTSSANDCRFHLVGHLLTLMTATTRTLICLVWFYTRDRRFGALKLWYEYLTIKLREKHTFLQILVIVGLFPVNIFVSAIISLITIPILIMICSLNIILKLFVTLKTKGTSYTLKTKIDHCIHRVHKERSIVFLYLLFTLQSVIVMVIIVYYFTVALLTHGLDLLSNHLFSKALTIALFVQIYLIYVLLQIYKARNHFQLAISPFKRIFPLLSSLWTLTDIATDFNQLKVYRKFANSAMEYGYKISILYFYFSVASLTAPVLFCFIVIIYNKKGFTFLSARFKPSQSVHSNRFIRTLLLLIDIVIGIPFYISSAILLYYIIIPFIIIKHGLDTVRKGEDEDRFIDWDPFSFVSTCTNSKGILELFGFPNVKSKYLPLVVGIEQIFEASTQTILAVSFLLNNMQNILENENVVGFSIPTMIFTLVFSVGSFLRGIFNVSTIIISFFKRTYNTLLFEDF